MLEIEVLEDGSEFAALEEEWKDLYLGSPLATPFQSWGWLYSWWEHYGEDYELRLVVMRDETGLLVGLAPLMLERRGGLGRMLFVGTGLTDHLDVLARAGREAEVAEACGTALGRLDGWRVADLQELRPESAVWGVFKWWSGSRTSVRQSACLFIDAEPWEDLLAKLSKNGREKARKTIRRAREDGVRCEPAGPESAREAAGRWISLHKEYWWDRAVNPEHLTGRFGSFVSAAAERMSASGCGGIYEFWHDREVIASDFVVLGREYLGSYLHNANGYALRRFQLNSLFMHNWLNVAVERGIPTVNLLRGEEPYKLRWSPGVATNHRAILARDPASFGVYAGYHAVRSAAARYTKSEDAPEWIRSAAQRVKGLLPT
jgi:CelD/BcsL family acetyltransferase involved in cellulose biosynthesis